MKLDYSYYVMSQASAFFFCEEAFGFLEWLNRKDPKLYGKMVDEFLDGIEDYETRELVTNAFYMAVKSLVEQFAKENGRNINKIYAQSFSKSVSKNLPLETDVFKSKDGGMFARLDEIVSGCLSKVRHASTHRD